MHHEKPLWNCTLANVIDKQRQLTKANVEKSTLITVSHVGSPETLCQLIAKKYDCLFELVSEPRPLPCVVIQATNWTIDQLIQALNNQISDGVVLFNHTTNTLALVYYSITPRKV